VRKLGVPTAVEAKVREFRVKVREVNEGNVRIKSGSTVRQAARGGAPGPGCSIMYFLEEGLRRAKVEGKEARRKRKLGGGDRSRSVHPRSKGRCEGLVFRTTTFQLVEEKLPITHEQNIKNN